MRSPACRMISLTFWRRRKGWSSFWRRTNPSAKSPQSLTQTSPWSLFLLPSHRPPSQWCPPPSLPASQPSPPPPTLSSPAAAVPSSPPPPFPAARSRWQTWTPPSWRSLWICWRRQRWRRRGQCQKSTCPTPSTQLRTGSPFTPQPTTLTLSPCVRQWWPAPQHAPPTPLRLCLPSQRRRPSPPVASHTGEEATATTSPLTPSAHQPCWPFKDSFKNNNTSYQAHFLDVWDTCADHRAMEWTCTRKQITYDFICLYIYLPITPM